MPCFWLLHSKGREKLFYLFLLLYVSYLKGREKLFYSFLLLYVSYFKKAIWFKGLVEPPLKLYTIKMLSLAGLLGAGPFGRYVLVQAPRFECRRKVAITEESCLDHGLPEPQATGSEGDSSLLVWLSSCSNLRWYFYLLHWWTVQQPIEVSGVESIN